MLSTLSPQKLYQLVHNLMTKLFQVSNSRRRCNDQLLLKDSICFLNLLIKLDLATSKEILIGLSKFISFSYIYELPIAIPIEAPRPLTLVIFTSTLFKKFLFKISDYSKILLF